MFETDWICPKCRLPRKKSSNGYCVKCAKVYHHAWYLKNKDRVTENTKRSHEKDPEKYLELHRKHSRKRREAAIAAYGSKCLCCGESRYEFLSFDHIYGDGKEHRKEIGAGRSLHNWLRRNGYPKDRFRLLCHNCNFARGHYGVCPHETEGMSGLENSQPQTVHGRNK